MNVNRMFVWFSIFINVITKPTHTLTLNHHHRSFSISIFFRVRVTVTILMHTHQTHAFLSLIYVKFQLNCQCSSTSFFKHFIFEYHWRLNIGLCWNMSAFRFRTVVQFQVNVNGWVQFYEIFDSVKFSAPFS